jgi:hypothetical protein
MTFCEPSNHSLLTINLICFEQKRPVSVLASGELFNGNEVLAILIYLFFRAVSWRFA